MGIQINYAERVKKIKENEVRKGWAKWSKNKEETEVNNTVQENYQNICEDENWWLYDIFHLWFCLGGDQTDM